MRLRTIIYTSQRSSSVTNLDIEDIVYQARSFNVMNGIAGILFTSDAGFCQLLQGLSDAVDEVLLRIAVDRRHVDVTMRYDRTGNRPTIDGWHDVRLARGFTVDAALHALPGDVPADVHSALADSLAAMPGA